MTRNARRIGGDNNKRGNRYEDFFAVFRMIEFAPACILSSATIRLKEQAGCPVDDLVLVEPASTHYHQLKSGREITWGADGGKLEKEFRAQQQECTKRNDAYKLVVVIAEEDRRTSLENNMPEDLKEVTSVFLFPILERPSQLCNYERLVGEALKQICADRFESRSEQESIVRAFHTAWVEHEPDAEGFCVLDVVVSQIREWGVGRLRHEWTNRPEQWYAVEEILAGISGLQWWADRGYFEWEFPPADRGYCDYPCESDHFARFIERVIANRPESFEEFERLLP